jgi:hypothetical protein
MQISSREISSTRAGGRMVAIISMSLEEKGSCFLSHPNAGGGNYFAYPSSKYMVAPNSPQELIRA